MTSLSSKKSSFPQIPQEVLKKAAESALVSSFVELNSSSKQSTKTHSNSRSSSLSFPKRTTSHKVVIDVDTKSSCPPSLPSDASTTTSVFIKVTPKTSPAFPDALREIKIHDEFLKELNQSKYRQKVSPLAFIPMCFLTQVGEDNCMIFLENLKAQEFQSLSGSSCFLDFNHALLAVETLARLHSASYFTRRQLGVKAKGSLELLRKFPYLKRPSYSPNDAKMSTMYAQFFDQITCKILEDKNPSLAFKLRRKFKEPSVLYDKMEQMLENEKYDNDDFYVTCHGDFRTGNLMFKYLDGCSDGEPSECRMVDMKSLNWAPIASDLAYFFLTSTTGKMRGEFEEKLLAFYCDSFEEHLKSRYESQGLSVQDFDIEDFHRKLENQYRRMLEYGFYRSVTELPILLVGNGEMTLEGVAEVFEASPVDFEKFVKDCLNSKDLNQSVVDIVMQLIKNRII